MLRKTLFFSLSRFESYDGRLASLLMTNKKMTQKLLTKISTFCVSFGLCLISISVNTALASPFTFNQNSISGESFWSGSFSGNDLNKNNILETNELNNFNLLLALDSVSFSLTNLSDFEYYLGTTDLISLSVQKKIEINNKFATAKEYSLTVNGFIPFSRLSVLTYLGEDPISVADGASNQPIEIQSIPEPLTLGGVLLASLIGANFKKISKKPRFNL